MEQPSSFSTVIPKKRKIDSEVEAKTEVHGLQVILSPVTACFTISIKPSFLSGFQSSSSSVESGCFVQIMYGTKPETNELSLKNQILSELQSAVNKASRKNQLRSEIKHLLNHQTDDYVDSIAAFQEQLSSENHAARYEEMIWLSNPKLFEFSLLRRLAMPVVVVRNGEIGSPTKVDFSFLDLVMQLEGINHEVTQSLVSRIKYIEARIKATSTETELGKNDFVKHMKRLRKLLIQTITRAKVSNVKAIKQEAQETVQKVRTSYYIPDTNDNMSTVRSERDRIIQELELRKQCKIPQVSQFSLGGKVEPSKRMYNGALLVTAKEASYEDFYRQKQIMDQVNLTFTRKFRNGISRPALQQLKMDEQTLAKLKSTFFDKDGSLKNNIQCDIDLSSKHGYINFANVSCKDSRNDKRWQIPIRHHSLNVRSNTTRAKVEDLFEKQGLLDFSHDLIHDMAILIGGTQDQSLHHDIPRQSTSWLPEDPKMSTNESIPFPGWEFDRLAYNEAMASPNAPSSLLISMNDSEEVYVGVQKNQIEKYSCKEGHCRIVNGVPSEEFPIIRETEFLVVIRGKPGVMFTGDFPHAGVRNVQVGSSEDVLMKEFFEKVDAITKESIKRPNKEIVRNISKMMCQFPNLNQICRFHCSTEPLRGPLIIPRNTVGFVGCNPNPP